MIWPDTIWPDTIWPDTIWIVMLAAGLLTFAARFSMLGLFGGRKLPKRLKNLLAYMAPAVLAAIIAPEILITKDTIALFDNPKIPAFLLAIIVAAITKNIFATIATGLIVLWLMTGAG